MKAYLISITFSIITIQGSSQQITTSDAQPLSLKTDTNNNTLFIGLSSSTPDGGGSNTFVGYQSGQNTTPSTNRGNQNTFIGYQAGLNNVGTGTASGNSGAQNTFVGYQAGLNSLGGGNIFMGSLAGFSRPNSTGYFNTFIGQSTGYNTTTGFSNIFLGSNSGYSNQSGNYNTFIGNSAGQQSQFGSFNTFIGNGAGYNCGNANYNLFMGAQAGFYTTTGNYNVMLGQDAGLSNVSGNNNVFIGWQANTAGANAGSLTNAIAIGANAQVATSNALVLGNNANVGIGTSSPLNKLEISQGTTGSSGLRFTNLTKNFTPTASTNKFLTVDGNGDVILANYGTPNFRVAATDTINNVWQASNNNIQNTNIGSVVIGPGINSTPAGYRLYVADGILTERVKVAVKTTDDWSDRVFIPGYNLRSLQEVERYIHKNQHLPGIPAAKEVVRKGIDVAKMDAALLEKIEELTVYTIELSNTNRKQQSEIDELKKLVQQLIQKK